VRLARGVLRHHRERDLSRRQVPQSVRARNQLAVGREDERHPYQVLGGNARIAQRQFERGEPLPVFPHTLGEEDALGDHVFGQFMFSKTKVVVTESSKITYENMTIVRSEEHTSELQSLT